MASSIIFMQQEISRETNFNIFVKPIDTKETK